jgi:multisubunit Na+/H+ antiporter MnhB subunit
MGEGPPIIIIGIALILVALALIALRKRGKLKQPIVRNKKSFFPLFIIGLVLSLTAAFFMFDGDILRLPKKPVQTMVFLFRRCRIC